MNLVYIFLYGIDFLIFSELSEYRYGPTITERIKMVLITKLLHTDNRILVTRGKGDGWSWKRVKEVKCMMMEGDFTSIQCDIQMMYYKTVHLQPT